MLSSIKQDINTDSEDLYQKLIKEAVKIEYKIQKIKSLTKKNGDYIAYLKSKIEAEESRLHLKKKGRIYLDASDDKEKVEANEEARKEIKSQYGYNDI